MQVKICGRTNIQDAQAAQDYGADMAGFVFDKNSPRHITPQTATEMRGLTIPRIALSVNADDGSLQTMIDALHPQFLQLHGTETPERVKEITDKFGIKIIKALGIETKTDLQKAAQYNVAYLLLDAKSGESPAGGQGTPFNWNILTDWQTHKKWILAGGLTPQNIQAAIKQSGTQSVDVSSGIESTTGKKDLQFMQDFITLAKNP
ncbi:MAG: phosphoribosylanthranilate isomerase [Parvibaculales bacterium]